MLALLFSVSSFAADARADDDTARAILVEGQVVTLDVGSDAGLEVGQHMAFYEYATTDLGDNELARVERIVAVGAVTATSAHRTRVRLGMNERVTVGTPARTTDAALTRSLVAPPQSASRTELTVTARLDGTVGATGGGLLLGAQLDQRVGQNVLLRVRVDPSGIVAYRPADPDRDGPRPRPPTTFAAASDAVALVAYDSGMLAFGAGLGVTMTTRLDEHFTACPTCTVEVRHLGFRPGLTFATMARFGVHDGLHVDVDTAFVAVRSRMEMSRLAVSIEVPVSRSLGLVAAGSGGFGVVGTRLVELGARMLVRGNGDRGSVLITPRVGYLAMAERASLDTTPSAQPRPHDPRLVHGLSAGVSVSLRF